MFKIKKITSSTVVDFAAEELKKYLRMMMPECGDISIAYAPAATDGFRLGLMEDFGLDTSEADDLFLDDILHIDVDGEGNGIIAGSNPRSVLLAVYRYLQENGCRWLYPGIDGEFIPMQDIVATKYHKMADCRFRGQCNEGAEFQQSMLDAVDFTAKLGMNVFMLEFFIPKFYYQSYYAHRHNELHREPEPITEETVLQWKRQCEVEIAKRGLQFHDVGHGWTAEAFGISSADGWRVNEFIELPDGIRPYLAEVGGKREFFDGLPMNTNLCMSNPVARHKVAMAVAKYAKNHENVDYLHIWLADNCNNHCECAECRKMTPSDWYLMIMNEIDEQLTACALDTRIVFISYMDTSWPATKVKLNNPDRFTLLMAPISRPYTRSVNATLSEKPYDNFQLNKNILFESVDQYIKSAQDWKTLCQVNAIVYEYHFHGAQYLNPGSLGFARIVHDDVCHYRKHQMDGLINDCTQRSFWPNGFSFYVYGRTLFDNSLTYEELLEDYFTCAYGQDWKTVEALFSELGEAMDAEYLNGQRSANLTVGKYYNPEMAQRLRRVAEIRKAYTPWIEAHNNMPKRVQTVSVRLLARYLEYCEGISKALILKCYGLGEEAKKAYADFLADFGKHEVVLERYYDFYLARSTIAGVIGKTEKSVPGTDRS
ncbi:MAG: DUF4838 domain-containing protein [Clostridia bacterium]|nr:DUF4838 domain-containing protein [Clostridia bacterium]